MTQLRKTREQANLPPQEVRNKHTAAFWHSIRRMKEATNQRYQRLLQIREQVRQATQDEKDQVLIQKVSQLLDEVLKDEGQIWATLVNMDPNPYGSSIFGNTEDLKAKLPPTEPPEYRL